MGDIVPLNPRLKVVKPAPRTSRQKKPKLKPLHVDEAVHEMVRRYAELSGMDIAEIVKEAVGAYRLKEKYLKLLDEERARLKS